MNKIAIGVLILALNQIVFAEEGHHGQGSDAGKMEAARFEKHKKMMLEGIDDRITLAQELKSCISSAKAHEDVQKCHHEEQEKMKKHQEQMQGKMNEDRKEALDDRIKRLQEEKSKLEQKK